MKKKIIWAVVILLAIVLLYVLLFIVFPIGGILLSSKTAKVTVIDDSKNYTQCFNETIDNEYSKNFTGLFEVFPTTVNDTEVKEFKYVHYNPWDPQYISYLTIQYTSEEYAKEIDRLDNIGVGDYKGIYSVTDTPKGYSLVALKSDAYNGFGYAMIPETADNSITYVGIDFCNYFLDLNINDYVPEGYLLVGFDATENNAYRKAMLPKKE